MDLRLLFYGESLGTSTGRCSILITMLRKKQTNRERFSNVLTKLTVQAYTAGKIIIYNLLILMCYESLQ